MLPKPTAKEGLLSWPAEYSIGSLIIFGILLIGVVDSYIKPRYWYIKEAEPVEEPETQSPEKLSSKGWMIFIGYCLLTVALFLTIPEYLDAYLSKWTMLITTHTYSGLVIGGAVYIMIRFSGSQTSIDQ